MLNSLIPKHCPNKVRQAWAIPFRGEWITYLMHTPAVFSTNLTKSGGGRCWRKSFRGSWRREGSQICIHHKEGGAKRWIIIMSSVLFICFDTFLWLLRSPPKTGKDFSEIDGVRTCDFLGVKVLLLLVSSQFEEKKEIHLTSSIMNKQVRKEKWSTLR